jgi:outer membrane protein
MSGAGVGSRTAAECYSARIASPQHWRDLLVTDSTCCRRMRIVAFLLAFLLPITIAAAQSSGPQPSRLTLAEALAKAEANYPRIRASVEQQSAAEALIAVARTAYLPRADMLWQTNRATANNIYGLLLPQGVIPAISGPVLPAEDGRSAWSSAGGALFSWQPFDFGARHAQVDVARHTAAAANANTALTRLEVELATTNAYFDLAAAAQFEAVAQANVTRLQVFSNTVGVLVKQELRAGADAAQADANLARARTQLIQAHTNVIVRRAVLANLIGLPASQVELDDAQFLAGAPGETAPETPLASHPSARREAAFVNQQQARVSAVARSYVPQFNAQAALSGRGAGTALNGVFPGGTNGLAPSVMNWALGMQVTFPAFSYFSLRAQKKAEEANLRAEKDRYEQTIDDLSVQVQQAQAQLEGARETAKNTPLEVEAARQSESQQRARFQAGLAGVVDVAAAESLLVQAEADDVVARLNVWRALAGVAAARGDLSGFVAQLSRP